MTRLIVPSLTLQFMQDVVDWNKLRAGGPGQLLEEDIRSYAQGVRAVVTLL